MSAVPRRRSSRNNPPSLLDRMEEVAAEEQRERAAEEAAAATGLDSQHDGSSSTLHKTNLTMLDSMHEYGSETIDDSRHLAFHDEFIDDDDDDEDFHDDESSGVIPNRRHLDPLYEDASEKSDEAAAAMKALYKSMYEEGSAMDDDDDSVPSSTTSASGMQAPKRSSFHHIFKRRSDASNISMSSAPGRTSSASRLFDIPDEEDDEEVEHAGTTGGRTTHANKHIPLQRRVTINAPPSGSHSSGSSAMLDMPQDTNDGNNRATKRISQRRQALRQSRGSGQSDDTDNDGGGGGSAMFEDSAMDHRGSSSPSASVSNTNANSTKSRRSHRTIFSSSRRSARRSRNAPSSTSSTVRESSSMDMLDAVTRLGSHEANSDWENVAAAAAVVAASAQAPAKRGAGAANVQFSQDDHVLVMLTLLNITNREDERDMFTVDAVNMFGYPAGEGKTDAQKQGPYSFVLCSVTNVHFDEDERYYTVCRRDTGSEQRADPGWMEPLRDPVGLEAAFLASQRTKRSQAENATKVVPHEGPLVRVQKTLQQAWSWPSRVLSTKLVPWYLSTRLRAKVFVTHVLMGDTSYACKMRLTGINLLVVCSFFYLFIDVATLAFLPARLDRQAAVVGFVVWIVLGLELLFEFLIRPANYHEIILSDKAFAPLTARNINRFHLICEALALALFIPDLPCVLCGTCGRARPFSLIKAAIQSVSGSQLGRPAAGRIVLGLSFLRVFGLVRHWKQMWINHTFHHVSRNEHDMMRRVLLMEGIPVKPFKKTSRKRKDDDPDGTSGSFDKYGGGTKKTVNEDDRRLAQAATIGTALMLVNSHRALFFLLFIVTIFPTIYLYGDQNLTAKNSIDLLQANNIAAPTGSDQDCAYLQRAVSSWYRSIVTTYDSQIVYDTNDVYLLWAQLLPVRCSWQRNDGVITACNMLAAEVEACNQWMETNFAENQFSPLVARDLSNPDYFALKLGTRVGGIMIESSAQQVQLGSSQVDFEVYALYNGNHAVQLVNILMFALLMTMLLLSLFGLTVMRGDAGRLVLNPLRRMLKIVIQYAENPLSLTPESRQTKSKRGRGSDSADDRGSNGSDSSGEEQLGNYETEQLINAIAKIADLLRKCWGVAGAGIISSNLARTKDGKTVVFNPTVPGKRVYALFGFVGINNFSRQLRVLNRDVMILINDVARVVHDEVFRWAHGDSGQCNKNLGSAFLMVFRIGDFAEVHSKKKRATDVVFNAQMKGTAKIRRRRGNSHGKKGSPGKARRNISRQFDLGSDGTLQLASLPGIQSFTDRALLGFLKSFAGLHRDKRVQDWKKDFRLGAGVGAFKIDILYGMDAGWAVEGAVGSEYKIDATYLSPHVNMASRMMSATKQYGVTILLSQAVEELLSKPARSKLRHLDTVYVKGSSVAQQIFTYDCRSEGVDYFLLERTPEQADSEAEAYATTIWDVDQDLRAMRQHVNEDFMKLFTKGVEQYIDGDWKRALRTLQDADNKMLQTVVEEGYVDFDDEDFGTEIFDQANDSEDILRLRNEYGDGACKCLIQYMERRNGKPPDDWMGVRHLMSK